MGLEVHLVPSAYVKPFVKRPTMRFVAVKSAEQQAEGMLFRKRDLSARQRTQTVNALPGHLAEHGVMVPQGIANVARLAAALEDLESRLPEAVRELGGLLLDRIGTPAGRIKELKAKILERVRESEEAKRRGTDDPWLEGMPARKPRMVVAVVLANKTARTIWATTMNKECCRPRAAA